ncbi:2,3-bisphosphoglycerate-independent phosphoglycerate mutase [Pseudobacteriovorax antillogorgiicola]|uniref:2,3-bisphosphoglycerate-independent phosphoglycerate mutase n=1 Tax=Pseudobacteriovorax antillogorgiicola TaxID=1513793 RepID=A0A1Y6B7P0_9BACT|nr:2,3-bisphosphoglycerate-independent phosphoglycerate mutase [Pseudobacteriovorax antillogorgiicola]TCS59407.1 phosphoglycerate mutase [Pseudobacteriovorax antillogorgiicola]SME88606.1 phosphoglycerate mutase [Pseudobacteriovorax antillogorgiicola]
MGRTKRRILTVVMDGVGVRDSDYGNAVKLARTPFLDRLKDRALYRTLKAHGTYVGLPSDGDIGNSEVGHNALGAGKIYDQGAKLVANGIQDRTMFDGEVWRSMMAQVKEASSTLHMIGLLSDGNVHAHQDHVHAMLEEAKKAGVKKVRLHVLLDGRDVGEKTAETYIDRLEEKMSAITASDFDVKVASGGGRMTTTMDRYEADWSMVERGWHAHVLGKADQQFPSLPKAIEYFRSETDTIDQYLPPFVIVEDGKPVGTIEDDDAVIFWNFRGDRAIEISRAFTEDDLDSFDRVRFPKVNYAGMMEYDGDLHIPSQYLVQPPAIDGTLGASLVSQGVTQFACSETQKFGHVTYFWNGNRSGYFDKSIEEYVEIKSDNIPFDLKPWMKAAEITDETVQRLMKGSFDVGRINYANGDMVGHTGNLEASIIAMATVDLQIGRLMKACDKTDTILMVTADHGNCDEMFDTKDQSSTDPKWLLNLDQNRPKAKTSHTLNEVPLYIYDPKGVSDYELHTNNQASIGNVASTILSLAGLPEQDEYLPSLLKVKS